MWNIFFRCKVPECEENGEIFQPLWLNKTIPIVVDTKFPEKCLRYRPISDNSTQVDNSCTLDSFDQSQTVKCSDYVYEDNEVTILKPVSGFWGFDKFINESIVCESVFQFNLNCDKEFYLSLIGTINNFGQMLSYLITGFLSDRWVQW